MGNLANDTKNLILGNDGSDKEPDDFKKELQKAINAGLISKADGTLLITSRTYCDKLAELIAKTDEKEVTRAAKEEGKEFNSPEEAKEYVEQKEKAKEEKQKKERQLQEKMQKQSLEQQIQESQNVTKAKMLAEKNLGEERQIGKK